MCEGYERETVFIVGTVDDKGRCASHPPRNLVAGPGPPASSASSASPASPPRPRGPSSAKPKKKKKTVRFQDRAPSSSPSPGHGAALLSPPGDVPPAPAPTETAAVPAATDLAPVEPGAPAWSDAITLCAPRGAGGGPYRVRFLAIRTRLGAVVATPPPHGLRPHLPLSFRAGERPRFDSPEPFRLASQCFLRLPRPERAGEPGGAYPGPPGGPEGRCLFLYEVSDGPDTGHIHWVGRRPP